MLAAGEFFTSTRQPPSCPPIQQTQTQTPNPHLNLYPHPHRHPKPCPAAEGDRELLLEEVASLGREAADATASRERWTLLDKAAREEAEAEIQKARADMFALESRLRFLNESIRVATEKVRETSMELDSIQAALDREVRLIR